MRSWRWAWAPWWPSAQPPPKERRQPVKDPRAGLQALLGNRCLARRRLAAAERARLEARLNAAGRGADLDGVELAHDPLAAAAIGARAFATADRIVLAHARDAGDTELIAEEAAHVVQARRRGTHAGISVRGQASEREARAAARTIAGGGRTAIGGGAPVPAVQRQQADEASAPAPAPAPDMPRPRVALGRLRPDLVRAALAVNHRRQGGAEELRWTPELAADLAMLLPDADPGALRAAFEPPPAGPLGAMARLVAAGLVPDLGAALRPEAPAAEAESAAETAGEPGAGLAPPPAAAPAATTPAAAAEPAPEPGPESATEPAATPMPEGGAGLAAPRPEAETGATLAAPPPVPGSAAVEPTREPETEEDPETVGEEATGEDDTVEVSPGRSQGITGLRIRVGVSGPLPPAARAARPFLQRGLLLAPAQVQAMTASHHAASAAYFELLRGVIGLSPDIALDLAEWLADQSLSQAARATARAELPSPRERAEQGLEARFGRPESSIERSLASRPTLRGLLELAGGLGITVKIRFRGL